MIKFENTVTPSQEEWKAVIRGMRNPKNSWDRTDTIYSVIEPILGSNDISLMRALKDAGTDHRKFMRMLPVYVDITAPLYWWKEFDTYKIGTVANSCSTMHKIQSKIFEFDDFSHDHLDPIGATLLKMIIESLNTNRELFNQTKDKKYWWNMIQLLPTSYNQKRTIMFNYEVINRMYHARKTNKLDEWHDFCLWAETNLPYSHFLIKGEKE